MRPDFLRFLLDDLREELVSGHRVDRHEKAYEKFFEVHETPKRGVSVKIREDAVREASRGMASLH